MNLTEKLNGKLELSEALKAQLEIGFTIPFNTYNGSVSKANEIDIHDNDIKKKITQVITDAFKRQLMLK